MFFKCKMKQKNTLSFPGNAVAHGAFLPTSFLLFLSQTHAPVYHRSMPRMSWMQRNIWCIVAATFKMIAMSSARSASTLSVVKPKHTRVTEATVIPPLANLDPTSYPVPCNLPLNPLFILLMSEQHWCRHIKQQVWITLRVESLDIQMRQKFRGRK